MSREGTSSKISYSSVIEKRAERLSRNQQSIIGIDIGSGYIKAVQMKSGKVIRWGMEAVPEGILNQGRVVEESQLALVIKKLLKKNKISGTTCSLCIAGNELIVRELKLPEMDEKQILENIKHEITSFLPLKQEEYCIDYKILEYLPQQGAQGKLRIMVAAIPNSMVNAYINALKMADLKTSYVDVWPNVAGKLVNQMIQKGIIIGTTSNIGIIDFGAYSTNVIIVKDGSYFLHKSITNGGDYLTSQIAKKYNIDNMDAEDYKKKVNFIESNYHNNEYLFIKNYLDYLIMDIERTIDFFKNRNNQAGLDVIYVTGGGSLLAGLLEYLKMHFNIQVVPISTVMQQFLRINDLSDTLAFYSQAIGTTLREE